MGYAARLRAAKQLPPQPQRLILGLTKQQKIISFKLSYALAMVDSLKAEEESAPGGKTSRRYVILDNLEEHIGRVLDEYRLQRFHKTDLDKAADLFETLDEKIRAMYP